MPEETFEHVTYPAFLFIDTLYVTLPTCSITNVTVTHAYLKMIAKGNPFTSENFKSSTEISNEYFHVYA